MCGENKMALIPNKYAGKCNNPACRKWVKEQAGFLDKIQGKYVVWCQSCVPQRIEAQVVVARKLTIDGKVFTPYEEHNLPLLRSIPGARWNKVGGHWDISLDLADRHRLLEIADELKLTVDSMLRNATKLNPVATTGLYPFQVEGVKWLAQRIANKCKSLLGDDMGLGKTIQVLMALPKNAQVVVVCPASLKYNWKTEILGDKEFAKKGWREDFKVNVLKGKDSWQSPLPGEITITSYNILPNWLEPPARKKMPWLQYKPILDAFRAKLKADHPELANAILVGDEWHFAKNWEAARTRKVQELVYLVGSVVTLTGTPLDNRPQDLYGVLQSMGVAYQTFGSWNRYLELFNAYKDSWGGINWGMPRPEVPELLRRVMLRRKRVDVLPDLPTKTYTTVVVPEVSKELQKDMDAIWENYSDYLEVADAKSDLPPFTEFSRIRQRLAEERIPAMLEYVAETEEQECPLVVFSAHLAPINELAKRNGWKVITGNTKPEERQQIVNEFQSGKLLGIGVTIRAGGVGITLTHAWKALFVDMEWNPGTNFQAEDRICRIGQKSNKCEIIRMVSNHPLDKHVQNLIGWKVAVIQAAIENSIKAVIPGNNGITHQEETEEQFQARMKRVTEEAEAKIVASAKDQAKSKMDTIHARQKARGTRTILPLTDKRVKALKIAFRFMLSVCDGAEMRDNQGFNKPDAFIAHIILSTDLETTQEVEAAYYMLTRYYRQLHTNYGVLFNAEPEDMKELALNKWGK